MRPQRRFAYLKTSIKIFQQPLTVNNSDNLNIAFASFVDQPVTIHKTLPDLLVADFWNNTPNIRVFWNLSGNRQHFISNGFCIKI
ncbi:MAG: hypothetical protein ACXWT2_07795 [Methylovulum sp.]